MAPMQHVMLIAALHVWLLSSTRLDIKQQPTGMTMIKEENATSKPTQTSSASQAAQALSSWFASHFGTGDDTKIAASVDRPEYILQHGSTDNSEVDLCRGLLRAAQSIMNKAEKAKNDQMTVQGDYMASDWSLLAGEWLQQQMTFFRGVVELDVKQLDQIQTHLVNLAVSNGNVELAEAMGQMIKSSQESNRLIEAQKSYWGDCKALRDRIRTYIVFGSDGSFKSTNAGINKFMSTPAGKGFATSMKKLEVFLEEYDPKKARF